MASEVAVRGDGIVAGEGRVVCVPKFHSWGKCTNEYQLRLDVQRFLWPVYYISYIILIILLLFIYAGPLSCNYMSKVTAPH